MEQELSGKVALVTGAARGLGRAIALELARRGANLIINDVPTMADVAAETVAEIESLGVSARFHPAFVNNAGIIGTGP